MDLRRRGRGDVHHHESDPAGSGFSLTDVSCSDANSTGTPFSRTVTVRLQGAETVTCTFRNLQPVAAPSQLFVFHLDGDRPVPPNDSSGRGGCFGQLNAATMSLVCTHKDLGGPVSSVEATWTGLTPEQISTFMGGNYFATCTRAAASPERSADRSCHGRWAASRSSQTGARRCRRTDSTETGNCTVDLAANAQSVFVQRNHTVPDANVCC